MRDRLNRADLLELETQEALDRFTQLAGAVLEVPIACVALVDADSRLRTSSYGMSPATALLVSYSLWRQVVASGRPLVVTDGRRHPPAARNPAVRDGTVAAYAGMPLAASNGRTVGTLFVMDPKPRSWTAAQLELLAELSLLIVTQMELVAAMRRAAALPRPISHPRPRNRFAALSVAPAAARARFS